MAMAAQGCRSASTSQTVAARSTKGSSPAWPSLRINVAWELSAVMWVVSTGSSQPLFDALQRHCASHPRAVGKEGGGCAGDAVLLAKGHVALHRGGVAASLGRQHAAGHPIAEGFALVCRAP